MKLTEIHEGILGRIGKYAVNVLATGAGSVLDQTLQAILQSGGYYKGGGSSGGYSYGGRSSSGGRQQPSGYDQSLRNKQHYKDSLLDDVQEGVDALMRSVAKVVGGSANLRTATDSVIERCASSIPLLGRMSPDKRETTIEAFKKLIR